ncbi:MAG TPA: tRNA (guanosine(37)-N1)-methyltransferase TrmD [Ruminococcaceae bacterium]|jgi:tRNA (guanine37-N1)-methyltransferase|nr:tRNA (guanosine(37)-N1)-methyltransferase TrmD [Oscillospiraceae bacterium]HBQ46668.1 tRNA (guanosine(37)-N1)-methyltransferase TrmD [Oscillospiraceae bacterium]HCB90710.1 tRNA (guanosine(37)-N1)-methyltransferase TrmD [Oscillospiraceae bacterium]
MRIDLLTLFPEVCEAVLSESIVGRARRKGAVQVCCHQIRDFAFDRHQRVDDSPFGGGMGMLLMAEPIALCLDDLAAHLGGRPHTVYLSPQGKTLTQQRVKELAAMDGLALLCGHYEGVDERVLDEYVDEELSIGDYVVTGGELPALILADAVCRLVPGVLSASECFELESHYNSLLEYPQYTRPAVWRGRAAPDVLLTGDHGKVRRWRREQALLRTARRRPELLRAAALTAEDRAFLRRAGIEVPEG